MNNEEKFKKLSEYERNVITALNCIVVEQESKFEDNGNGCLKKWTAKCISDNTGDSRTIIENTDGLKVEIIYSYEFSEETFVLIRHKKRGGVKE